MASIRNLAQAIRERFAPFGGVELEIPPREPMRDPPTFEAAVTSSSPNVCSPKR